LAKRINAHVIAVDVDPDKLELALKNGADEACLPQQVSEQCAEVCINFAPTTATWAVMVKAIRTRGRIVAAAMVSDPVPLSQEWLASVGVKIMGTSVGTRAQMKKLLLLHEKQPLHDTVEIVKLQDVNAALENLRHGKATGRYCIAF
jgi:alcohol dehydrogenase, propanol-preferring